MNNTSDDRGRKGLIVAIIIVAVLLLALGGFVAFKLLFENKETASSVTVNAPADSIAGKALTMRDGGADKVKEGSSGSLRSDAQVLGFMDGVREVAFGFDAGYGYTYQFDRDGQLISVSYFDECGTCTMTLLGGRVLRKDGEDFDCESENPSPVSYHSVYEYRPFGEEVRVYEKADGRDEYVLGSISYGEDGRIARIDGQGGNTILCQYDDEGRAYSQDGDEVYPPLALFFVDTPLLPKEHKVKETDAQGRTVIADAQQDMNHYDITYWQ